MYDVAFLECRCNHGDEFNATIAYAVLTGSCCWVPASPVHATFVSKFRACTAFTGVKTVAGVGVCVGDLAIVKDSPAGATSTYFAQPEFGRDGDDGVDGVWLGKEGSAVGVVNWRWCRWERIRFRGRGEGSASVECA